THTHTQRHTHTLPPRSTCPRLPVLHPFQVWSSRLLKTRASRETQMVAPKSSPTPSPSAHRMMFTRRSAKLCRCWHRLWSSP
ncbi:unnamed protein product, partial [Ectocarpus sp. 8 AP-2014]